MNVLIENPSYRLKNYEVYLRNKEIEIMVGKQPIKTESNNMSIKLESRNINKLHHLTFASTICVNGHRNPTWQALLENGNKIDSTKKESKYVTHGLHQYKGKFYPQLVKSLFNLSQIRLGSKILDPFCGSGTMPLEGYLNGYRAFGCDLNPLAVKISKAKVEILNLNLYKFEKIIEKFLNALDKKIIIQNPLDHFPENCVDEINRWFPKKVIKKLVFILTNIEDVDNPNVRQFLLVVLSSIIRNTSQQDPQDLRMRKRKEPITDAAVLELYKKALSVQMTKIAQFFSIKNSFNNKFYRSDVWLGDARDVNSLIKKTKIKIDGVFTSPPYATALPYIDTDRLSLLTVFNFEAKQRNSIEMSIIGSREINNVKKSEIEDNIQSEKFENINSNYAKILIKKIHKLNAENDVGFRRLNMASLLYRYFNDMSQVFKNLNIVTKKQGDVFIVIGDNYTIAGNSKVNIETTKIFKEIGTTLDWTLKRTIPISVTTEGLRHIKNSIRKNYVLHFQTQ